MKYFRNLHNSIALGSIYSTRKVIAWITGNGIMQKIEKVSATLFIQSIVVYQSIMVLLT